MSIHNCLYCDRHFKFKDLYETHIIMCEFFNRSKREKEREMEAFEHIPSQHELYKLVMHLTVQCSSLQKEVDKLKHSSGIRTRKIVIDKLNHIENPTTSFEDWYVVKQPILQSYLDLVYQEDLIAGIKRYISDLIISEKTNIPMRTFAEKPNTIYVYSQDADNPKVATWKIMSNEQFMKWINRIAHRFSQEFSIIQADTFDVFDSSEAEKEKNIIFMMKINGGKISGERRANDIKKWITGNLRLQGTDGSLVRSLP